MVHSRRAAGRLSVIALLTLAAGLLVAPPEPRAAPVCTITWDGGGGNTNWGTPANWDLDRLPEASDHVCIPASSSVVHSVGADSISSLDAQGTLTLSAGSLTLTSTADASVAVGFVMTGGTLDGGATLELVGTSTWSGGTMAGPGTTRVRAGAVLLHPASGSLAAGRVIENAGTIDITESADILPGVAPTTQINNLAGATVKHSATTLPANQAQIRVPLDNHGSLEAAAGTLEAETLLNYDAASETLTGGTYRARGATLGLPGGVARNAAHLVLDGATAKLGSPGGADALAELATNAAAGTLELRRGANPELAGPFTNAGTLRTALSGAGAGEFGRLLVKAVATLGGTLAIETADGYEPATGTEFRVLSASARQGTFESVSGGDLPASKRYEVVYGASAVTVRVTDEPPPPVLGQTANVGVVKGKVLVGVPAQRRSRAGAAQKGIRFVPLEDSRQIPIGSFLDTRRGTVRLTVARNRKRKTQSGQFAAGLFQVLQSRRQSAKGLTELRLKGAETALRRCRRGKGAAAAATDTARADAARRRLSRRAVRRLRGRARGRFRTRGRHSAATVRGTTWTVTDSCAGTLTEVKRGKVAVRDFRRKKTIVLTRGKRYLARAPQR